jgi:hypothetical protein
VALALGVEDEVITAGFFGTLIPVLGAKIGRFLGKAFLLGVVDMIIKTAGVLVRAFIGDGDEGTAEEGHGPIAVVAVTAFDLDRDRFELPAQAEPGAEEIADRSFDGRIRPSSRPRPAAPAEPATGAAKERLANCSGAEHLVWREAKPNDRLVVHFPVVQAGRYSVELNLCKSPDYGRMKLSVNGMEARPLIDGYSPTLDWQRPKLGLFDPRAGDNTLEIRVMAPNPEVRPGNLFGLDYIFLVRHP